MGTSKRADSPVTSPSYPPMKVGPKKTTFPGDTIINRDQGFWEPFGREEQGVEGAPGERGELIPGRPPEGRGVGIPLPTVNPSTNFDDTDRKNKIPKVFRGAATISAVPKEEKVQDERLLLQIPHDLKDRYEDLAKRIHQYTRAVDWDAVDVYNYKVAPPPEWVDEEMKNVQIDWEDDKSWRSYLNSVNHEDFDTWLGPQDMQQIAPSLHSQFSLEAADGDFHKWFMESKPSLTQDESLVSYSRDNAKKYPDSGIGKAYIDYWKKRNLGRSRGQAYNLAKERWLEQVKQNGKEYVNPKYKDHLENVVKSKEGYVSLKDLISSLENLPLLEKEEIQSFREEFEEIVGEGMHSLDFSYEPTGRDDRLFGDLTHEGLRWVPVNRVEGIGTVSSRGDIYAKSEIPIPVYRYGSRYFLVDENGIDFDRLDALKKSGVSYIQVDVTNIIPGSSIRKKYALSEEEFNTKSAAIKEAIRAIEEGENREAVFLKYGRVFGPGLRKAVGDYLYIQSSIKTGEGGGGSSGSAVGDSTCSSFAEQTPDNCGGCTFDVGTGGPEFGYGGCVLTQLFLDAPETGFGRGDPAAYDPAHTPGRPSIQKTPRKDLIVRNP